MSDVFADLPDNANLSQAAEAFSQLSPDAQQELIYLLRFLSLPE